MSENADRLDRIERIIADLAAGHQIEVQMRHEEMAHERAMRLKEMANERKMRQSLARHRAKRRRDVEEQRRVLVQMLDALISDRKKNGSQ